jgi:hypothetical protein
MDLFDEKDVETLMKLEQRAVKLGDYAIAFFLKCSWKCVKVRLKKEAAIMSQVKECLK